MLKQYAANAAVIHNTKWTTKLTDNCWLTTTSEDGKQEQMESACYYAVTEHYVSFLKVCCFKWKVPLRAFWQQTQPSPPCYQFSFSYKKQS